MNRFLGWLFIVLALLIQFGILELKSESELPFILFFIAASAIRFLRADLEDLDDRKVEKDVKFKVQ